MNFIALRRGASLRAISPVLSLSCLLLGACPGGSPTSNNVQVEMAAAPYSAVMSPGQDILVQVVLHRVNGFSGPLVVHLDQAAAGSTSFATDVTVPGDQSTVDFTIHTTNALGLGLHTLFLQANGPAGTGGTYASAYFQFTAVVQGSFLLALNPQNVSAGPGAALTTALHIARNNFPGVIQLTATATANSGIVATLVGTNPAVGDDLTMNVTVPGALGAGTYTVKVTGTSGTTTAEVIYTIELSTGQASTATWTFCPTSGLPLFVARQDGNGPWTAVTGVNNSYSFPVATQSGAIAYVVPRSGGGTQLVVFYGSLADLQSQGGHACAGGTGATKTINGAMVNTGMANNVGVSLGPVFKYLNGSTGTFQFAAVPPGSVDLIGATLLSSGGTTQLLKMLLRANQNIADNGAIATMDFAGTEAFVPTSGTLTMVNTLGQITAMSEFWHSTNNALSPFFVEASSSTATSRTVYAVPASKLNVGDTHWISVDALTGTGNTTEIRTTATSWSGVGAGPQLTFGPALDQPMVTVLATAPVPRLHAIFNWQSEYPRLWQADFVQSAGASRRVFIQVTAGYRGPGGLVTLDIPDLSGVAGWSNSYGLVTGVQASWNILASGWIGTHGITFPDLSENNSYYSATKQGVITP